MAKNRRVYKKWDDTHLTGTADCHHVIKLDSIAHLQQRLSKELHELEKSATKLEDGKPDKGRKGRLSKTAIEKLRKHYCKTIRNNVTRDISSAEERDIAATNMQKETKAGLDQTERVIDIALQPPDANLRRVKIY